MAAPQLDAKQIFLEAVDKHSPEAWPAFLDDACRDDGDLRQRVESLLSAHGRYNEMLDGVGLVPTLDTQLAERPGIQIGPYKLLQQIGEGGFGVVFMAEQSEPLRRRVALKVIKPGMDTRQVIARFEAERQALAVMDHPNIARVFDGGATESGRPYFVMELVRGISITQFCDENNLSVRERLELFATVCQAIQHAHTKGIIHRDIKPSNVLITRQDGEPAVKVIDFGIAKAMGQQLTEKTLFTDFAAMIGTPLYMSPEQAELSSADIDTRSDIFSLGVLLYELLTGSTPVSKEKMKQAAFDEVRRIIREDEPERPSTRIGTAESAPSIAAQRHSEPAKLARLMRGELDWIAMKALEKDRNRRYETASGFAADIERYLNDEAVEACPPSATYRLKKFARKNRAALATTGTIAMLLIAGTVISGWQALRATKAETETARERDTARTNERRALSSEKLAQQKRREALAAQEELRNTLYSAEMNLVEAAWEADNLLRIRDLLGAQIPKEGQRDLRGFEWRYWDRLCHAEANLLRLPEAFPETPWAQPMFARAGTRLAAVVPKEGEHELNVWDAITGGKSLTIDLPGLRRGAVYFAPSADGERIATIGAVDVQQTAPPFDLRVLDANTGSEIAAISVPPGVGPEQSAMLSVNADGSRVLTIVISVERLAGNPASATATSQLNVWDVATGKALLTVQLGSIRPGRAISLDGGRVAAIVSLDGKGDVRSPHAVRMWDVATGQELQTFKGSSGEPFSQVVFSPDGQRLAATGTTLGADGIWIWDAATGQELRAIGGRRALSSLNFSPDGKLLANYDRHSPTVTLWDCATGETSLVFKGHATGVLSVAFDAAGRQLRTLTLDGAIRTWNIPVIERPRGMIVSATRLAKMAISSNGARIADLPLLGPEANRIEILDLSGKRRVSIPLPSDGLAPMIDNLVLSRDGARMAMRWNMPTAAGAAAQFRVWDTMNGKELLSRTGEGRQLLALSPDGDLLAVPFAVGEQSPFGFKRFGGVNLLDVTSGEEVRKLELNPHPDLCLAEFSPDGTRLATMSLRSAFSDPRADQIEVSGQIWDVASGKELARLSGGAGAGPTMTFSPKGSLLAIGYQLRGTSSGQAVIDVVETASGRKRFTLRGHSDRVVAIAFSPDGQRIASGALDPTIRDSEIRIWSTASGKTLSTLTCRGAICGLAFGEDGHQLIGVRNLSPDSEAGWHVWDATPRPERLAPP